MKNFITVNLVCFLLVVIKVNSRSLTVLDRHQIVNECIEQVGLQRSVIDNAVSKAQAGEELPQDNEKYKEFLACSYKKQGYMNDEGEISMENVKTFISTFYEDKKLSVLDSCKPVKNSTNHGETAFHTLECILDKLRSLDSKEE